MILGDRPNLVVFTTLAMNQTRFFAEMGRVLTEEGYRVAYVCFHERSHEYLRSLGLTSFNVFEIRPSGFEDLDLSKYGTDKLNLFLSHEKAAFEISDSRRLIKKYRHYLAALEVIFNELIGADLEKAWLVQELGGFLSLLAAFQVARARGIDNIFIEPSFFRGRVFFVRNSFAAPCVKGPTGAAPTDELNRYLDAARARQSAVIPVKDVRHYRSAVSKVLDGQNIRRLWEKLRDKYLLGKREEFGHVVGHAWRHLRMALNSQLLKLHYCNQPSGEHFIYYPLHVPADVALTLRSPDYLDQYALIDFIARSVPHPWKVLVKEHPALVGAVDYRRMRQLLTRRDNVMLVDPGTNNYTIMRQADAVITVNSKSGAEALLVGTPVVVLGDAFYRTCAFVHVVDRLRDLPETITKAIATPKSSNPHNVNGYFQDIWMRSFPGELYDITPSNIAAMAASLREYLTQL